MSVIEWTTSGRRDQQDSSPVVVWRLRRLVEWWKSSSASSTAELESSPIVDRDRRFFARADSAPLEPVKVLSITALLDECIDESPGIPLIASPEESPFSIADVEEILPPEIPPTLPTNAPPASPTPFANISIMEQLQMEFHMNTVAPICGPTSQLEGFDDSTSPCGEQQPSSSTELIAASIAESPVQDVVAISDLDGGSAPISPLIERPLPLTTICEDDERPTRAISDQTTVGTEVLDDEEPEEPDEIAPTPPPLYPRRSAPASYQNHEVLHLYTIDPSAPKPTRAVCFDQRCGRVSDSGNDTAHWPDMRQNGNASASCPNAPALHRRAISEHATASGTISNEEDDQEQHRSSVVLRREVSGRSVAAKAQRVRSQVIIGSVEEALAGQRRAIDGAALDRLQSTSDPHLADDAPSNGAEQREAESGEHRAEESWRAYVSPFTPGFTARNIFMPVNMPGQGRPHRPLNQSRSSSSVGQNPRSTKQASTSESSAEAAKKRPAFFGGLMSSVRQTRRKKATANGGPSQSATVSSATGLGLIAARHAASVGNTPEPRIPLPDIFHQVFRPIGANEDTSSSGEASSSHSASTANYALPPHFAFMTDAKYETLWREWSKDSPSSSMKRDKAATDDEIRTVLGAQEFKRQKVIEELYEREKRHCCNLVFLQHAWVERLCRSEVLSAAELALIVPKELPLLIDFHLGFLRRLNERIQHQPAFHVDTIADIIEQELSSATAIQKTAQAYVALGSQKTRTEGELAHLIAKNSRFATLFQSITAEPLYERHDRSYKTLMSKVIGHPTRYGLLCIELVRCASAVERDTAVKAESAARRFAAHINEGLNRVCMSQHFDNLAHLMDPSSVGLLPNELSAGTSTFSVKDLLESTPLPGRGPRRLVCRGNVGIHLGGSRDVIKVELYLFDDILVFLQPKGSKLVFWKEETHNTWINVCPLHPTLVRPVERRLSIMLVIMTPAPALYDLCFEQKTLYKMWLEKLESVAGKKAPELVRRAPHQSAARNAADEQLARQRKAEEEAKRKDEWVRQLATLFEKRKADDDAMSGWMDDRMAWMDTLREHLLDAPLTDENRDELRPRLQAILKAKFDQLHSSRAVAFDTLLQRAEKSRDEDLKSLFDDVHHPHAATTGLSTSTSAASSADEGTSKYSRPRRIHTFHGTTAEDPEAASCSHAAANTHRRHTTTPRVERGRGRDATAAADDGSSDDNDGDGGGGGVRGDEEDELQRQRDRALLQPIAVGFSTKAHAAASQIVRDNARLRRLVDELKSQVAHQHCLLQLHALTPLLHSKRSDEAASCSSSSSAAPSVPLDLLEQMRIKERQVRQAEAAAQQAHNAQLEEIARQMEALNQRASKIARDEEELEEKWRIYHRNVTSQFGGSGGAHSTAAATSQLHSISWRPPSSSSIATTTTTSSTATGRHSVGGAAVAPAPDVLPARHMQNGQVASALGDSPVMHLSSKTKTKQKKSFA